MSKFLYNIGKIAYNNSWKFIVSWIVILTLVGVGIATNGIHMTSDIKIEGTESQKVLDKLTKELPEAAGGQASVVFTTPEGERLDTPERLSELAKVVNEVYGQEYVINPLDLLNEQMEKAQEEQLSNMSNEQKQMMASMTSEQQQAMAQATQEALASQYLMVDGNPLIGVELSENGNVALFQFQFTEQLMSVPNEVIEDVKASLLSVENADLGIQAFPSDTFVEKPTMGATEAIGLVIAAIVLFITLGSVVAAGLPLITAIMGVAISVGGTFVFSKYILMTDTTPSLALMIGLAVGIDYSLFIVNRQRTMILEQGLSAQEATGRAIGTAGSAVFFAGLTVIIALCGMLVIQIEFLSVMALVAALSVFVNVLIALTLLPAILGLIGDKICNTNTREQFKSKKENNLEGFAHKWITGVVKNKWIVSIGIILVLGISSIPVLNMQLGMPSGETANLDTSARQSFEAISDGFGKGYNSPLLLVIEPTSDTEILNNEVVVKLTSEISGLKNVEAVTPMGLNEDGNIAIYSVIPKSGPIDEDTKELVAELRDENSSIAKDNNIVIGVTGFTAINNDMSEKLSDVFPMYVVIILGLSLIILLLVFRSIIVPIKATLGFLLSIFATFGITTAIFQWGWLHNLFGFDTGGPLLSFMPIMVTGILYGLAMDYQVFLVSSMRESYVHGLKGDESIIHGYRQASKVVLAAAIIMVSVFAGFIMAEDVMLKQIGFALTIGIFIDAFFIRMTLVPAIMSMFGDEAWSIPKWLDKLLPNLDVEGDKLITELNKKENDLEIKDNN